MNVAATASNVLSHGSELDHDAVLVDDVLGVGGRRPWLGDGCQIADHRAQRVRKDPLASPRRGELPRARLCRGADLLGALAAPTRPGRAIIEFMLVDPRPEPGSYRTCSGEVEVVWSPTEVDECVRCPCGGSEGLLRVQRLENTWEPVQRASNRLEHGPCGGARINGSRPACP